MPVFPEDCSLSRHERGVFLNTAFPDEFPCDGCMRTGCPMKGSLAAAESLSGDVAEGAVVCRRCGRKVRDWRIDGDSRVWVCRSVIETGDAVPWAKPWSECGATYSIFGG